MPAEDQQGHLAALEAEVADLEKAQATEVALKQQLHEAALSRVQLHESLQVASSNLNLRKSEYARRAELVEGFPSETQLLKLERRQETLKAQFTEAERSASQTKTGIDAYTVRCDACATARVDLTVALEDATAKIFEAIEGKVSEDCRLVAVDRIRQGIDDLIGICEDREATLLELNQKYTERLDEEAALNERIVALQQKYDSEGPKMEQDADRFMVSLTDAWNTEKEALQLVYDKLYAINKEQQHHLARGTHVKRDTKLPNSGHESALSARHSSLSAQLIEARERLHELQSENGFVKKTTDQLRAEGRLGVAAHENQTTEVIARLRQAREERLAAEEEARKFRNLKVDLHHALQTIRETPSGAVKAQ
jgi:hypothetical protein